MVHGKHRDLVYLGFGDALDWLEGSIGVEVEGHVPVGGWKTMGCVPLPNSVLREAPPATCPDKGQIVLNSTYGDLEFIVSTSS